MAWKPGDSNLHLHVDGKLKSAQGSLEGFNEFLQCLGDVDARVGKVDCVESLLELGAGPGWSDGGVPTAVDFAISVTSNQPEEEEMVEITRWAKKALRSSAEKRGEAREERNTTDEDLLNQTHSADEPVFASQVPPKIKSLKRSLIQQAVTPSDTKTTNDSAEVSLFFNQSTLTAELISLNSSTNDITLKGDVTDNILDDLVARDTARTENLPLFKSLNMSIKASAYFNCVEAMVRKTSLLNRGDLKIAHVRLLFEEMYLRSPMTACLLKYLQFQPRIGVVVDCDSAKIGRLKAAFTDHDMVERKGSAYGAFADFVQLKAYLGAKMNRSDKYSKRIGILAVSLAQLAIYSAFMNHGRPYHVGDERRKEEFKRIMEEAREKYSENGEREEEVFDDLIMTAFKKGTQLAQEIYLISAVPGMIARYGDADGTQKLQNQLPSLFNFYKEHVMCTLLNISTIFQSFKEITECGTRKRTGPPVLM